MGLVKYKETNGYKVYDLNFGTQSLSSLAGNFPPDGVTKKNFRFASF
jgi:hypothetical protein